MNDFHSHKCVDKACGTRWDHERLVGVSEKAYEDAHRCPGCGKVQYMKHFGAGAVQTRDQAAQIYEAAMSEHLRPPMPAGLAQLVAFLAEREDDSDGEGDEGDYA